MQNNPKIFQIVLFAVFVILFILGFLGFSGKINFPTDEKEVNYGEVVMWGSLPSSAMQSVIISATGGQRNITIKYVEKKPENFNTSFVEALANGVGPDIVLIPQSELLKNLNKLAAVPYQTILERDFKNTFIEEGEMFFRPEGVVALPLTIDPLVMYWNRDIFTTSLLAAPPKFWTEFYDLVPKVTKRDRDGSITQSLVPFGEYRNVSNAKEILSTLMMQAGSPIVTNKNGAYSAALITPFPVERENPVITALRFFTEFAKPDKDSYSWNRSLPLSRSMFEAGDLAMYFGYASEYSQIKQRNPHLNFDVAMMPQVGPSAKKITFGRMYGVAIVRASKNQAGALHAVSRLSSTPAVEAVSIAMGLPPVRRDLISKRPTDAVMSVFYDSALIARAWHDPLSLDTNNIFLNMIDSVNSSRASMTEALSVAQSSLEKILQDHQRQ